jgi:hypothetical protein
MNLGKLVLLLQSAERRGGGGAFLIYSRAGTLAPDSRRVICFDN